MTILVTLTISFLRKKIKKIKDERGTLMRRVCPLVVSTKSFVSVTAWRYKPFKIKNKKMTTIR
jgi:hypothetical protein